MNAVSDLRSGFDQALASLVGVEPMGPVMVAFSGGLDSCVLLHLLRFGTDRASEVFVAHFDHAMRDESAADAEWVRGLCLAWDVPLTIARAQTAPASEAGARKARYEFLERVRAEENIPWLMTAHHADDQAETVLFRVLRGTGIEGLAGIPGAREPGLIRPLLGFWRDDLEAYAHSVGLSWREDASNAALGYARNTIRRSLLPLAEAQVAQGARRSLVRLAGIARENEAAWESVLPDIVAGLDLTEIEEEGGSRLGLSWNRDAACALSQPLQARVVRHLAALAGRRLEEAGTRLAVEGSPWSLSRPPVAAAASNSEVGSNCGESSIDSC
jgi:tRNA(Ile)-lysidine synthase